MSYSYTYYPTTSNSYSSGSYSSGSYGSSSSYGTSSSSPNNSGSGVCPLSPLNMGQGYKSVDVTGQISTIGYR